MTAFCPACGRWAQPTSLLVEESYRLYRCSSCRTEFFARDRAVFDGPVRESAYWEDYKFSVYRDPAVLAEYEQRYERVLRLAEDRIGPIRSVLDIGCGVGNFLAYAAGRGITAVGADVEARAVEVARTRGLHAVLASEVDGEVPDGSLDAASMWDVVEHLLD
ncbi:MAG: methyltransferase domain-containing protein, partial [Acidimicrobiales bacterium]|nr:methyltransferase domain-containing protein [Acidimicrobiales bacterium]